ncbi:hypothetical protein SKAU_G00340890 [Synaphobranchus kaupii]|uniref:Uncharacterized protein n=1 Tax=Synaphobranchus kaupii TaxID=118154 RepID=A0A9Q1EMZ2_SYNKA|nr:hypothetical protein SKAU_G00340890 [Synaphobranchus kaupii]
MEAACKRRRAPQSLTGAYSAVLMNAPAASFAACQSRVVAPEVPLARPRLPSALSVLARHLQCAMRSSGLTEAER